MAPTILLHLDQSRSGGHLLQRILSEQPKRHFLDHPFSQARGKQVAWLVGSGDNPIAMSEELWQQWREEYAKGIGALRDGLAKVERDGQILFVQEHCFNSASPEMVLRILEFIEKREDGGEEGENVTCIPEDFLTTEGLIPLFTIRDPRLAVPSAHRVLKKFGLPAGGGKPNFRVSTNLIWIRMLYAWFVAHGVEPVIVDCDDVQLAEGTDFLQRLCGRLGLDGDKVRLKWPRIGDEEREKTHPSFYASQSRLLESDGVNPALAARGRDWVKEEAEWEAEFGEDFELVGEMVKEAEVHYRWLVEKKFR